MGKLIINDVPDKVLWGTSSVSQIFVGSERVWPANPTGFNVYLNGVLKWHEDIPYQTSGTARGRHLLDNFQTGASSASYIDYEVSLSRFYGMYYHDSNLEYEFDHLEYGSSTFTKQTVTSLDASGFANFGFPVGYYRDGGSYVNVYLRQINNKINIYLDGELFDSFNMNSVIEGTYICLCQYNCTTLDRIDYATGDYTFGTSAIEATTNGYGFYKCTLHMRGDYQYYLEKYEWLRDGVTMFEDVGSEDIGGYQPYSINFANGDNILFDSNTSKFLWNPEHSHEFNFYFKSPKTFTVKMTMVQNGMEFPMAPDRKLPLAVGSQFYNMINITDTGVSYKMTITPSPDYSEYEFLNTRFKKNGELIYESSQGEVPVEVFIEYDPGDLVVEMIFKYISPPRYAIYYNASTYNHGWGFSLYDDMSDPLPPAHFYGGHGTDMNNSTDWKGNYPHYIFAYYDEATQTHRGHYRNEYPNYQFDHIEWGSDMTPKQVSYTPDAEYSFTDEEWKKGNAYVTIFINGTEPMTEVFQTGSDGLNTWYMEEGTYKLDWSFNDTVTMTKNGDDYVATFNQGDYAYMTYQGTTIKLGRWVIDGWLYFENKPSNMDEWIWVPGNSVTVPHERIEEAGGPEKYGTFGFLKAICHLEM